MSAPNQRLEQFKDYQHKNELLSTKYWRRANGLDRGANERLLGGYVQRWVYWALWCFPKLWNYLFPISREQQNLDSAADLARKFYGVLSGDNTVGDLKSLRDSNFQLFTELPLHLSNLINNQIILENNALKRTEISSDALGGYLEHKDFKNLNETCTLFYQKTQDAMYTRKLEELLQRVVYGKQDKAEEILKTSPELLLKSTATVIDYSSKKITGLTPFQAALCAGDVEMCEMMRPYFEKLDNGLEEMQRQYDEIFHSGIDAHTQTQKQAAYDFDWIYQKIKGAPDDQVKDALKLKGASFTRTDKYNETDTKGLTKGQLDNLTLVEALNRFREEFDKLSKSEKIFNPYHLLEALELYSNKFYEFTNLDQQNVFWRQIIGYCQRNLPACYAQATAQGVYSLTYKSEPLKRTMNFRCNNKEAFYPFFVRGCSGLGFDWAGTRCGDARGRGMRVRHGDKRQAPSGRHLGLVIWEDYVKQKHQAWSTYESQSTHRTKFF